MTPTALLRRMPAAPPVTTPAEDAPRLWTRDSIAPHRARHLVDLPEGTNAELRDALAHCAANGLTLETVEQEDIRLPSLARAAGRLRLLLDEGPGFFVLRGIDLAGLDDEAVGIVAWGIGNYLGRPVRQGLTKDRRLFTVTDAGSANIDPTRIGASSRESRPHTDNGCLEPRPPCAIGLLCVSDALAGGDSWVVSAATIYNETLRLRPDLAPLLQEGFHFLPPHLHTWPAGPNTIVKPILESVPRDGKADEIRVHYARVMVEPGMTLAGTPLTPMQIEALDLLDSLIQRPDLGFSYRLQPGEFLFVNNLVNLHGRGAYADDAEGAGKRRVLKRLWLWRRHVGPGDDPAALDLAELT
ncbi:TauD/TfdA family dioxygenase [Humitalea sp. 24SJ18S-53]|uniref:TauD/TfdA family dioxygenase n=1 Tax=Humitalea sp. 24SJ18S-53 TaxID=3422307 RepID=UPI003D6752EF